MIGQQPLEKGLFGDGMQEKASQLFPKEWLVFTAPSPVEFGHAQKLPGRRVGPDLAADPKGKSGHEDTLQAVSLGAQHKASVG